MTEELKQKAIEIVKKNYSVARVMHNELVLKNFDKEVELCISAITEATKELQESLMKLQKSTFNMIDEKNNRITELEKENAELKHTIAELRLDKDNLNTHTKAQEKLSEYRSNQLTKAKEVINDLVHLGEFNEHTDEEYFNYQVHEVLKNAEQFLKE